MLMKRTQYKRFVVKLGQASLKHIYEYILYDRCRAMENPFNLKDSRTL